MHHTDGELREWEGYICMEYARNPWDISVSSQFFYALKKVIKPSVQTKQNIFTMQFLPHKIMYSWITNISYFQKDQIDNDMSTTNRVQKHKI